MKQKTKTILGLSGAALIIVLIIMGLIAVFFSFLIIQVILDLPILLCDGCKRELSDNYQSYYLLFLRYLNYLLGGIL